MLLLILVWGLLQTNWGQNWLARQVTKKLSKDLQAHISIKHVRFHLFDKINMDSVLIEDQKKDTLLFAGTVQVNVTDWFFFKDKAVLKYVGISDAVVNFNRTDSIWNYAFLEEYFGSSSKSTKKNSGIAFDLKKLVLNHVSFVQKDAWNGFDFKASVSALNLDANEINLTDKILNVSDLHAVDPEYSTYSYKGNKSKTKDTVTSKPSSSPSSWNIRLDNISIVNGRYKTDVEGSVATVDLFDPAHMDFSKITGNLDHISWVKDTVRGIVDITAQERSGLVVKSLKTNATVHPTAMIFDNLLLETNRSVLSDRFSMEYKDGMKNFIHAVTMEANFTKTSIASDDIAFFVPSIKSWNRVLRVNGRVRGTIDALNAKNIEVWAGDKTYINGNISLIGLPNINETLINLEAKDLRTTYADAINVLPSLRGVKSPDLKELGYIQFKGTYSGLVNDFVTFGTIQTALGSLTTDLNMKFPKGGTPAYSGKISTAGFQLGAFLNNSQIGTVSFDGKIKGTGFDLKTLNMEVDGDIHHLDFEGYRYQNLFAKGVVSNRKFNGDFRIKDPNVDLTMKGLIDFAGTTPLFNVKANIATLHLKPLHFYKEDIQLHGDFDLNIQGSSLSDLLGNARITNASLLENGRRMQFDSLVVSSVYSNGTKILKAQSNELDATVTGNFDLKSLPQAFALFLSRYYPSYIKAPGNVDPQAFSFEITTGMVEDYLQLFDKNLSGLNNSRITGALNTTANTMTVDADVPFVSYKQFSFSDIRLKGDGDFEKLTFTGLVNNAVVSESLNFPQTNFSIVAQNDVSNVTINTMANQTINSANLSAQINTFSDGATIIFNPSSFVLNDKTWSINQGGELNFRTNTVVQGQLTLKESEQEIQINTQPSAIGNWNDLHVAIHNLNLGDLSPIIMPKNRLDGLLNGDIIVEDPQNKFDATATVTTQELRLDNDSIGQIDANVSYNNKTGLFTGKGNNTDPDHHIDFDLAMNFKDSANIFKDHISLHPQNFELKFLERFLGTIVSDIQGYATGDVDIVGEGANRDYLAKVKLKGAGFKVNFTQVNYRIEDTEIELKKDRIDLEGIQLRDLAGNQAVVHGNIRHTSFRNMYFDLVVQTQSKQMELLNTRYIDNQQFYGKAWGSGTFVLLGPQNDMLMNIDVKASETDSSYITLPPAQTRQSGQASFMVEKKYGKEMSASALKGIANLDISVTLAANPLVNMEVILDELTGDVIKGRGSGVLTITSGTTTPLSLNGRFDIDEGNYLFTFQSFFKKPFVLRKGANNYIEWTGDPYKANINIVAVYTAEKVSFAPLATLWSAGASTSGKQISNFRDDVNVVATLTGELFQPSFSFKLEFPSNRDVYREPGVAFGIQQIEKNTNELNKQVTYLIVFNSFAPYEGASTTANPVSEALSSTLSGLLFGEVNRRLNELLSKVLQKNNLTFNFSGSLYNRNPIDQTSSGVLQINQSDVNIAVGKSLFEGRVNVTVGGTFDVPLQADIQQSIRLFPDVTVEILLNKSGSVRASFFYRENVDYLNPAAAITSLQTRRLGASISYGREFNSFSTFFSDKKKKMGRGIIKPSGDTLKATIDSTKN